jgi:hypothetical protein
MEIRPQDLPELRADFSRKVESSKFICDIYHPNCADLDPDLGSALREVVGQAEMFYVSPEMADLAGEASKNLLTFELAPHDLPVPVGLMIFGSPIRVGYDDGCPGEVHGFIWISAASTRVSFMPVATVHAGPDAPSLQGRMHFTTDFGEVVVARRQEGSYSASNLLALAASTWLLMRQRLASASDIELDRAARKRLRRAGQDPAPVRVIELRRPRGSSTGDGSGEYHHQWIVRGHWRQHWHPKRQVHRPVWIAPHVKGPEGAPLIGGEKVYALKR